jgi:hypothetical protein
MWRFNVYCFILNLEFLGCMKNKKVINIIERKIFWSEIQFINTTTLFVQITCNKPAGWTSTCFGTFAFLSEASYEAQQMLDLNSETLIIV